MVTDGDDGINVSVFDDDDDEGQLYCVHDEDH